MPDAPVPRHLYPQLADLIAYTQKAIKDGALKEPDQSHELRDIDAFFLAALGRSKMDVNRVYGGVGALVLWNIALTAALVWVVFIR